MDYVSALLAALATFASPCVLPMLPVFVTYFSAEESNRLKTLIKVLAFCLGISVFFIILYGTFIGIGAEFTRFLDYPLNRMIINIVCGSLLVVFGLKFIGLIRIPFLDRGFGIKGKEGRVNVIDAFVMGLLYSFTLGSCALGFILAPLRAVLGASVIKGVVISFIFIITLDLLFIACAMLMDELKGLFKFVKKHYRIINIVAGCLLIIMGILLATGMLDKLSALISV